MQLKGLVRFFAIALILICLYQLSFTWFVKSHESAMEKKADTWMKQFPAPEVKYPGNKELQAVYADSLADLKRDRLRRLLDSTKAFTDEAAKQARLCPLAVFGVAFVTGVIVARAWRR